jgi:hypothetical protein
MCLEINLEPMPSRIRNRIAKNYIIIWQLVPALRYYPCYHTDVSQFPGSVARTLREF